jgi:3-hydroxyisobutyrate dehydrogenase/2-hydroxy-3-oxopropionate reductase
VTTYGFLGLGIMGGAMAANLARAGFDVTVWNRTAEKAAPLVSLGAHQGTSPREVVEACDITFAMLADPAAVEAVCAGPDGVLAGTGHGHDFVNMSTVDDITSRRIADAVAGTGGRFLEAPVTGTKQPAEEGTLVILAAGDESLFEAAAPAFGAMGKTSLYLGEVGNGARMKLVVNAIMAGVLTALCEGMALGLKSGLDGERLLDVIDAGAFANPMFRAKGRLLLDRDYPASFPLKHTQKDLRLAVELSERSGQPLHCIAAVNETFKRARITGHGDEDISAVFEAIR